nr:hypothetical protein [Mycoplasmopsis bovis]
MRLYNPTHMFIAFDAKGKTKRHEVYDNYKAGREKSTRNNIWAIWSY